MPKISKDNLGYLGVDYQYRLINAFISDPSYFKDNFSIIDQNKFTDHYLKALVGAMRDYYIKQEIVPSYEMILIELRSKVINTEEDEKFFTEILDKVKKVGSEGYAEVEAIGERFFKQQEMLALANGMRNAASEGDVDKIDDYYSKMEKLATMSHKEHEATTPMESVEEDLSVESIVSIPTGVGPLDEALGGGLRKGNIGIIIAPLGCGKTSMTTCFAANAATALTKDNDMLGYKVLQIVFEDTHRDIHRKYFAKISQVETRFINRDEETTDEVRRRLKESPQSELLNNNIKIMRLPSGEKTASDIKSIIKQEINKGFRPDLVIIDYFECIKLTGPSALTKWDKESLVMRKIEAAANELNIAFWVPVQGNRDSINTQLVGMDNSGGSIGKIQIAHIIMTITRSVEDIAANKAIIAIVKNRAGSSGRVFNNVDFDNGTCTISTDNAYEEGGIQDFGRGRTKEEDDEQREMLKQLHKEIREKAN